MTVLLRRGVGEAGRKLHQALPGLRRREHRLAVGHDAPREHAQHGVVAHPERRHRVAHVERRERRDGRQVQLLGKGDERLGQLRRPQLHQGERRESHGNAVRVKLVVQRVQARRALRHELWHRDAHLRVRVHGRGEVLCRGEVDLLQQLRRKVGLKHVGDVLRPLRRPREREAQLREFMEGHGGDEHHGALLQRLHQGHRTHAGIDEARRDEHHRLLPHRPREWLQQRYELRQELPGALAPRHVVEGGHDDLKLLRRLDTRDGLPDHVRQQRIRRREAERVVGVEAQAREVGVRGDVLGGIDAVEHRLRAADHAVGLVYVAVPPEQRRQVGALLRRDA
mmetsp:Transcript_41883/g.129454  ORF Transcript_41883/g.129454 Transcript_41883/m.129454 type:complete len:338 (-) Transcript_41883:362-1375(-)